IASIATLGFRGEALPSIAAVSKLTLLTKPPDSIEGTRIEMHGGERLTVMASAAAPGTFIEVNELFYNTPARFKFLKSPATELSYINAIVTDHALANPQIGFHVKHNAKEQVQVSENSDLIQRIAGLFGRDIIRELTELQESAGSLELQGFIGLPSCHRATRTYQKIFVNGRPVKDKVISHAIQQAYDTLVPKRRYPVVFLSLRLPVQLVDVNVHPTKMEIRFVNSQTIHNFIVTAIRNALSASVQTTTFSTFSPAGIEHEPDEALPPASSSLPAGQPQFLATPPAHSLTPFPEAPDSADTSAPDPASLPHHPRSRLASFASQGQLCQPFQSGNALFARMRPVGQFHDTYILAQAEDDLVIIDQHAAHERIFYERLQQQVQRHEVDVQQLLFPVSIELSHQEQAVLEDYLDTLQVYGLELEPFGGTTVLLKAVPAMLLKADSKKLVYDIIDQLSETSGKTTGIEQKLDEVLMLMACHAAIRAHHHLQEAQMLALFQQMDALDLPFTCPHGRPTVIKIGLHDLEKKFGRI
ncbi:hypothetical protein GF339_01365, partial [candidate division KSB3 bacterium]|nr:hypothetical protein [candidate division KSB3 bacterium]MBD3323199.1 hypothetical protein [candidate division KSB3 bacterium]